MKHTTDQTIRLARKAALTAHEAVHNGIRQYETALDWLKEKIADWRNLPQSIAEARATLTEAEQHKTNCLAALTKPLESYATKARGWQQRGPAEYQHPAAEAARRAFLNYEQAAYCLQRLEGYQQEGYAAYVSSHVREIRDALQRKERDKVNYWQTVANLARLLEITEPYSAKDLEEAWNAWQKAQPTAAEKRAAKRAAAASQPLDLPARLADQSYVVIADTLARLLQPFDRHHDLVVFCGTDFACRVSTLRDLSELLCGQVRLVFDKAALHIYADDSHATLKTILPTNDPKQAFARLQLKPI